MIYQNKNFNLQRISQSEIRNSAAAESEGGPRRRNFVSLRGKQKFFLFACPVASRGLCYGARPSVQFGAHLPAEALAKAGSAPSVSFKIGSDLVKQTHQYQTFRNFADRFSRAKRGRERKYWLAAHGAARQAQVRNPLRF